jgi:hypothetical protein
MGHNVGAKTPLHILDRRHTCPERQLGFHKLPYLVVTTTIKLTMTVSKASGDSHRPNIDEVEEEKLDESMSVEVHHHPRDVTNDTQEVEDSVMNPPSRTEQHDNDNRNHHHHIDEEEANNKNHHAVEDNTNVVVDGQEDETEGNQHDDNKNVRKYVAADAPYRERLWEVLITFWPLGLVAFGGPQAHVALLRTHLVTQRQWLDEDTFLEVNMRYDTTTLWSIMGVATTVCDSRFFTFHYIAKAFRDWTRFAWSHQYTIGD